MDSRGIPIVATQKHPTTPRRAPIYSGNHTPRRNNDIPSSPFINLRNEHSLLEAYDSFTDACFQSQFNHSLVSECFNFRDLFRADLFPSFNELPTYPSNRKRSFTAETEEYEEDMLAILGGNKKPKVPMLSSPSRSMTPMEDDDEDEEDELESYAQHMMPSLPLEKDVLQPKSNNLVKAAENSQVPLTPVQSAMDMSVQKDRVEHVDQDMMQIDEESNMNETIEAKPMLIDPVQPSDDINNKQIDDAPLPSQTSLVKPQDIMQNATLTEPSATVEQEHQSVANDDQSTQQIDAQEQDIPNQEVPTTSNHTSFINNLPDNNILLPQEQAQIDKDKASIPTQLENAEAKQSRQEVKTRSRTRKETVAKEKPSPIQPKRVTRSRAKLIEQAAEPGNTPSAPVDPPKVLPSISKEAASKEAHDRPAPKKTTPKEPELPKEPVHTEPVPKASSAKSKTPTPEPSVPEPPTTVRRSTRVRKPTAIALEQKAQQPKPRVTRKRGKKCEEGGLKDTVQEEMKEKTLLPTPLPSSVPPTQPQSPIATTPTESLHLLNTAVSLAGKDQLKEQSAEGTQRQTNTKKQTDSCPEKRKESENELQRRARRKAESDTEIKQILYGFPSLSRYYQLLHRAGSGTFSRVYKARDLLVDEYMPYEQKERLAHALGKTAADMKHVAIKVILDISTPARVANEIECLLKLRSSPGITPLITAFRNEAVTYVVLPYIDFDPFEDFYDTMTLTDARSYVSELLIGLQSAHEKGIAHRDVKPGNFLYSKATRLGYLADFGLARKTCPSSPSKRDNNWPLGNAYPGEQAGYYVDDTRPALHADRSGTRGFRAPELLMRYKHQTTAVDIWAVGVILLIILSGQYPFFEPDDDADSIMELAHVFGMKKLKEFVEYYGRSIHTNIPTIPEDEVDLGAICHQINKERVDTWDPEEYKLAVDLMKKCLQLIHTNRLTATEALNHPFFFKTVT
ncbi:Cell cycle serine/threonine-protein kinase hsk1 [Choanephora cucurbitarum]|uniref:non-specific serine/threonine protein kinase n=1 Tax=Choanephora cucurbitarum TaxID=101091 RepID=A0A1C7N0Q1_9FUNG|nr:Cell cycle serine/threonine-protein kinase hsk1 [Choanephora cucurbitarum]